MLKWLVRHMYSILLGCMRVYSVGMKQGCHYDTPEAELLGCGNLLAPCEHGIPTRDETSRE